MDRPYPDSITEYGKELLAGNIPADFCFPMTTGMSWGKVPNTSPAEEFVWRVTSLNADPFGPIGGDTFHMQSHLGAGDWLDRWFTEGIGVVQEIQEHHGTYDEYRRQLLSASIRGKRQTYQLTPARTAPLSTSDCRGPGWRHYARSDGASFKSVAECTSYFTSPVKLSGAFLPARPWLRRSPCGSRRSASRRA